MVPRKSEWVNSWSEMKTEKYKQRERVECLNDDDGRLVLIYSIV